MTKNLISDQFKKLFPLAQLAIMKIIFVYLLAVVAGTFGLKTQNAIQRAPEKLQDSVNEEEGKKTNTVESILNELETRMNRIKHDLDMLEKKPRQIDNLYHDIDLVISNYVQNRQQSKPNVDGSSPSIRLLSQE